MRILRRLARLRGSQPLPTDLRISLVDSLYSDPRTLFIGSLGCLRHRARHRLEDRRAVPVRLCPGHRAGRLRARTRHALLRAAAAPGDDRRRGEPLGVALRDRRRGLHGAARRLVPRRLRRAPTIRSSTCSASRSTLAYMIGIVGAQLRQQAAGRRADRLRRRADDARRCSLRGDAYYAIFGCVLVPFFVSLKFISDRLRRTLLDAVIATPRRDAAGRAASTPRSTTCRTACACSTPQRRLVVANRAPDRAARRPARAIAARRLAARRCCATASTPARSRRRDAERLADRPRRAACPASATASSTVETAGRAHARAHLRADGERRLGGARRGHHRAQERRGARSTTWRATTR